MVPKYEVDCQFGTSPGGAEQALGNPAEGLRPTVESEQTAETSTQVYLSRQVSEDTRRRRSFARSMSLLRQSG